MSRFNLLDEAWISVMIDGTGKVTNVSLKELYTKAHEYRALAGDTRTQDFAVLRFLLSVLHTVFSRLDENGMEYGFFELDDRYRQVTKLHEDDLNEYSDTLLDTWINLWGMGKFPAVIIEYLEKWRDKFYLLDDENPFYQVTYSNLASKNIKVHGKENRSPSTVFGKTINRLISESGNKISLFSSKYDDSGKYKRKSEPNIKSILKASELARWLITYQGYSGTSDKAQFAGINSTWSKGWIYDLGGIHLEGNNLHQTLLLNCPLPHPEEKNQLHCQKPCWEFSGEEQLQRYLSLKNVDNIAELYTNWSRAIYIDPEINLSEPLSFNVVKLPEIKHQNQFLEPMTIWKFNESGINKGTTTPRKHIANRSMWRSFGLITMTYSVENPKGDVVQQRKPGLIDWLEIIREPIGDLKLSIYATSMKDDGNATSWLPVDEITDYLYINDFVLTDVEERGWVPRINNVIERTKMIITTVYKRFITDLKNIRNISSNKFVNQKVEELFFVIDQPFRDWISYIEAGDSKDQKVAEWRSTLKKIILDQAEEQLEMAGNRDYLGIVSKKSVKNIATAYNWFIYSLNKELGK